MLNPQHAGHPYAVSTCSGRPSRPQRRCLQRRRRRRLTQIFVRCPTTWGDSPQAAHHMASAAQHGRAPGEGPQAWWNARHHRHLYASGYVITRFEFLNFDAENVSTLSDQEERSPRSILGALQPRLGQHASPLGHWRLQRLRRSRAQLDNPTKTAIKNVA
jgi:hypothetical protein